MSSPSAPSMSLLRPMPMAEQNYVFEGLPGAGALKIRTDDVGMPIRLPSFLTDLQGG